MARKLSDKNNKVQVESTDMTFSRSNFETGWCFHSQGQAFTARVKLAPAYLGGVAVNLLPQMEAVHRGVGVQVDNLKPQL